VRVIVIALIIDRTGQALPGVTLFYMIPDFWNIRSSQGNRSVTSYTSQTLLFLPLLAIVTYISMAKTPFSTSNVLVQMTLTNGCLYFGM
jgi:hypothetical protein